MKIELGEGICSGLKSKFQSVQFFKLISWCLYNFHGLKYMNLIPIFKDRYFDGQIL